MGREGDRHARVVFWVAEIGYQHCRHALAHHPLASSPTCSRAVMSEPKTVTVLDGGMGHLLRRHGVIVEGEIGTVGH